MTVESTVSLQAYTCSGPGTYDFSFPCQYPSEIQVKHTSLIGIVTYLSYLTEYTVSLNTNTDGGSCIITNSTFTSGRYTVQRVLPFTQLVDLIAAGDFDPETLERALDRCVMLLQQMNVTVSGLALLSNWYGPWASGVVYPTNAIVIGPDKSWYICSIAHTSLVFADEVILGQWETCLDYADLLAAVTDAADNAATIVANSIEAAAAEINVNKLASTDCTSLSNITLDCAAHDIFVLTNVNAAFLIALTNLTLGRTITIILSGTSTSISMSCAGHTFYWLNNGTGVIHTSGYTLYNFTKFSSTGILSSGLTDGI